MQESEPLDVNRALGLVRPRSPLIAFLLSILTPGLGHVYNGKPLRGLVLYGILKLTMVLYGLTGFVYHYYGLWPIALTEVAIRIFIMVDAIKQARRGKGYVLKRYNHEAYYMLIGAVIIGIGFVYTSLDALHAKTYKIPTTSLEPTVLAGDQVVVRMFHGEEFKFSYGDIVAFNPPGKRELWFFRIVALPGDSISLKRDNVILNGIPNPFEFLREGRPEYLFPDFPDHPTYTEEFGETFPNGKYVHVLVQKNGPDSSRVYPFSALRLNSHQYFLMGDNRDNANDSRYLGPIDEKAIKGLLLYSYWGKTRDRINVDFRK